MSESLMRRRSHSSRLDPDLARGEYAPPGNRTEDSRPPESRNSGAGTVAKKFTIDVFDHARSNRGAALARPSGIRGRRSVAMWFSQEASLAYETGIAPALSDAGLLAVRKGRPKHTNEIVTLSGYNGLSLKHFGMALTRATVSGLDARIDPATGRPIARFAKGGI
jgi:hypothetical protein